MLDTTIELVHSSRQLLRECREVSVATWFEPSPVVFRKS